MAALDQVFTTVTEVPPRGRGVVGLRPFYPLSMPHLPVSDAAADLHALVAQTAQTNVPVTLTVRGDKVAVLLSAELFDYVVAATSQDRTLQRLLRRRNGDDVPDLELVRRELESG